MNKLLKRAFTLVELLVVIAIVGILSGLIIVSMNSGTQKATIAKSQIFSNSLRNSLMAKLISEWKLDGNATDSWGTNNGTINGATSNTTNCVRGTCYSFDGNDDYIDLTNNSSLSPTDGITIEAWFYSNQNQDAWTRFLERGAAIYDFILNVNALQFQVTISGSTRYVSGITVDNNRWHYVTGTWKSGDYLKTYIDGDYKGSSTGTYTGTIDTNTSNLELGRQYGYAAGTRHFNGILDEIRIYGAAIPASQIKKQYYLGLNSLLANGNIDKSEYLERIGQLAINLQ